MLAARSQPRRLARWPDGAGDGVTQYLSWPVRPPASRMQYDFQFLPPTQANRLLLSPAIPPGYRQVPPA